MSEQQLQQLQWQALDISPDAIVVVDQHGEIIFFNQQAENLLAYRRAEVLGEKIEILIPEEYRRKHVAHRTVYMENPRSYCIDQLREVTAVRKDGLLLPVDIKLGPIEIGTSVFVCVSIRDASMRLERDEAIQAKEARYRDLLETMNEGFAEADQDYRFSYVNSKLCQLLGYQCKEMLGRPLLDFIHDDDKELMEHQMNLRRQGIARPFELTFAHKSGDRVYTLASPKGVFDEDNNFIGSFGVLTDLTELKQDERALRTSEERYRALVETISCGVQESDLDGKIIFSNKGHSAMHGYEEGGLLGKYVWDPAISNDKRQFLRNYYQKIIQERPSPTPFFTQDKTKNGDIIDVQVDWNYRYDVAGELSGFVSIITDISERKQVEKELEEHRNYLEAKVAERTAELESANKELDSFSYSVSHDLSAPLRYIDGFSSALMEDYQDQLDENGKKYLQKIRNSAQNMKGLIDALLSLSRVTRGDLNRENVNLSDMVQSIISKYQGYEPNRSVNIDIQSNVNAWGDARLLEILLGNLIGNAWKYTGKSVNARIGFSKVESEDGPVYCISDNGVGFDMQHAQRLFGAFQRLHKESDFKGTGIGLATVARIIRFHGGQVWAEAQLGQGASFYFTLGEK